MKNKKTGVRKSPFKGILFDLDGTLLDTIEDIADSMNVILKRLGYSEHGLNVYKKIVGEGVFHLVNLALPKKARTDKTIMDCAMRLSSEYARRWDKKTKIYDGVNILLNGLVRKKVKMAILSNKPDDFTKKMVKKYLGKWKFKSVAGASTEFLLKPDPGQALNIVRKMKLKPHEVVFLGDTNVDMKTAKASGMYPAGALWGFRSRRELVYNGAKTLLKNPQDLLALFDLGV